MWTIGFVSGSYEVIQWSCQCATSFIYLQDGVFLFHCILHTYFFNVQNTFTVCAFFSLTSLSAATQDKASGSELTCYMQIEDVSMTLK